MTNEQSMAEMPSQKTADKVLRVSIIVGIFLLPFIVLIVANHEFFPFITGKNFTFRIIVETITALWLILALRDRSVLPKTSKLFWAFAAFVAFIFISDCFSPNVFKSFWSNFERMEGWVTLVHLFALFVVLSSVMTRKLWQWLFRVSVFVSIIAAAYGALQLIGKLPINQSGVRLDATFGNATYLAVYMLFHVFFGLLLITWEKRGSLWQWLYGLAIVADAFILYHTATRGATLGLIGGLFLTALLVGLFDKKESRLRKISLGVIIALAVLVAGFFAVRNAPFVVNSPVLQRFSSISFTDKTAESRFMIWDMAWQGFKESPKTVLVGWGQESFNYVFNKYYQPAMYSQEQWFDRAHNIIFDWLIAGGLLGLLAYLSLFVFAFYYLWRKGDNFSFLEKSLITGLFAGYFVQNLTVFDNITSYLMFIFVLAWIQSIAGRTPEGLVAKIATVDLGTANRVLAPLVAVIFVFIIYYVNVPALLASSELITALSPNSGGPAQNLADCKQALAYHSLGDSEIREQLVQVTTQAISDPNVDPSVKNQFVALTRSEMDKQLSRTPQDARYWLFAGSFLASVGDYDNAIADLTKAHELSSNKQTILFSLVSAYLGKKDFTNAVSAAKQAFDLDQSFDEARKVYAIALLYGKQGSEAAKVLAPLPPEQVLSDQRFLQAFIAGGYFQEALQSINLMIQQDPNNPNNYLSRAAIEHQLGQTAAAISDLQKIEQLSPNAKAQVESIIQQLRSGK